MIIYLLLALLLLIPAPSQAKILESNSFESLLRVCKNEPMVNNLVVTDIDNTLIEGAQHLGSLNWREYNVANLVKKGVPKADAKIVGLILWKTVQPLIKVKAVDPNIPKIINTMQKSGIIFLGVTSREPDEIEYTHRQLHSVSIDLEKVTLSKERMEFNLETPVIYDQGVLFCSASNKKSIALMTFLLKIKNKPDRIIYISDDWDSVREMERALKSYGVASVNIRFSGCDELSKQFDPRIAKLQWNKFPEYISDEQAKKLITEQAQAQQQQQLQDN